VTRERNAEGLPCDLSCPDSVSGRPGDAAPFPWNEAMAFGLGVLRLAPEQFWSMTPRELERAASGVFGRPSAPSPLARRELSDLMRRFPDPPVA
jgi:uncharacterized phage protein (TIGR02216 family)